jgi:hypothetical protein
MPPQYRRPRPATVTPIRAARADAMWREVTDRADVIEHLAERVAEDDDVHGDWSETVETATHMTGVLGLLATFGPTCRSGMSATVANDWVKFFGTMYSLNVQSVTRHLRREAGWTARQVDVALNDLADRERVRLVAEGGGDVRIEVLVPRFAPEEHERAA